MLFQKLALWMQKTWGNPTISDAQQLIVLLEKAIERLNTNADSFRQIASITESPAQELNDFAKLLQLLSHPELSVQTQALQLLLSYDSKAIWDALMVGATIEHDVQHSVFRMTAGLSRALLQNPHHDYSSVRRQVLVVPFADDLRDLHRLDNLEELHLHFWGNLGKMQGIFSRLLGLEKLPKLRKLVVILNGRLPFFVFPDPNWTRYMGNIEELEFHRIEGPLSTIDYAFVDALPNLRKLTLTGLEINYAGAQYRHQPELVITSSTSARNRVNALFQLIPKEKRPLRIKKLILNSLSADTEIRLSFLRDISVEKLVLSNVKGISQLHTLAEVETLTDITARNVSQHKDSWTEEQLRTHGVDGLESLLNHRALWKPTVSKLSDISRP